MRMVRRINSNHPIMLFYAILKRLFECQGNGASSSIEIKFGIFVHLAMRA